MLHSPVSPALPQVHRPRSPGPSLPTPRGQGRRHHRVRPEPHGHLSKHRATSHARTPSVAWPQGTPSDISPTDIVAAARDVLPCRKPVARGAASPPHDPARTEIGPEPTPRPDRSEHRSTADARALAAASADRAPATRAGRYRHARTSACSPFAPLTCKHSRSQWIGG
jgi:hypothetical protein